MEVDVDQVADRMKKDEQRLASGSSTPKELESLQHELQTLGKRKSELEDGQLEVMIKHDSIKARVDELLNDQAGLKQLDLELNIRLENASADIHKAMDQLTAERSHVAQKIEKALIDLYDKVRAAADGIGAALLVGNKCDGCHLSINIIELNRIKDLAADEVIRCEECRRILVRV
jgi:predicted  nucleic acid-binding Zn-ribbon protein